MGKDITKKFTINLEIATKDAEKQVAASADNIKKLLNNAVKDGVNVKELRDMANTINSMFEKIGQAAPLDIDKNFKGNGSATKRIEMLTDALDKLFIALNNDSKFSLVSIFSSLCADNNIYFLGSNFNLVNILLFLISSKLLCKTSAIGEPVT